MYRNILLTIEYDGTGFSGWQKQPDARTVQGVLEEALGKVCGCEISLNGTSRTDSGVHALGQRASFAADLGIPVDRIKRTVNNILRGRSAEPGENSDVRIVDVKEMPPDFHARFDSKGKKYRYVIRSAGEMPVFLRNYRYHVERPLDADAMRKAAEQIVGTHDFACFQAAGSSPRETTVRTIHSLEITEKAVPGEGAEPFGGADKKGGFAPRDIEIEVSGDGFLYNMVRIIAGTLTDVGLGKISPEDIAAIIESADRTRAGHTAPPQGLYLVEVYY